MSKTEYAALFKRAAQAGADAMAACVPDAMLVGTPTTVFGTDIDYSKRVDYVEGGVCGFAWVNIRPATSGFARWLSKTGKGSKGYYGGLNVRAIGGGQSLQRKEAWAQAFAEVLREAGYKAFAESRMD